MTSWWLAKGVYVITARQQSCGKLMFSRVCFVLLRRGRSPCDHNAWCIRSYRVPSRHGTWHPSPPATRSLDMGHEDLAHRAPPPSVADPGGARRPWPPPPGPVKISHKKDGCQRQPHRFHVSSPPPPPPPHPAAGSTTVPTSDISWPSLETCSNLFVRSHYTGPPSQYWHLVTPKACMVGK